MIKHVAKLNPVTFIKHMWPVMAYAFSTSSSNATLPITLKIVEGKIGVKNEVASFTVPLGATINMDGTAIMQGVATVFIAQAFNVDIGMSGYLMVILTATLASIGTAGVPGVGLIMLALVLQQVGLPVEGIALIIGVDRLLDMMRTAVNVTGDATVSAIVARSEGKFDIEVFESSGKEPVPAQTP
jgi:Na+/H+-dicarboxylate symporter